jgi:hypothetical protein
MVKNLILMVKNLILMVKKFIIACSPHEDAGNKIRTIDQRLCDSSIGWT